MNRPLITLFTLCTLLFGCSTSDGGGIAQGTTADSDQPGLTDTGGSGSVTSPDQDAGSSVTDGASAEADSAETDQDTQEGAVDSVEAPEDAAITADDIAQADTGGAGEDTGITPGDTLIDPQGDAIEATDAATEDSGALSGDATAPSTPDVSDDTSGEEEADGVDGDVMAEGDTGESSDDAGAEADVEEGPAWLDPCPATVTITGPATESFHLVGAPFIASAMVTGPGSMDGLSVRWETEAGDILGQTPVLPDGTSSGNLNTALMPLGVGPLFARVVTPDGVCSESKEVSLVFCQYEVTDDFSSLDNAAWKMFGSSYWDSNGWLEMTGTAQGQHGAVYNPQTDVAAGSASITFSMATGGGSGADGFAMTIVQTDSIAELEDEVIASAVPGSGIGYAVGGAYGSWEGNAFTVEIDTYENVYNGTNELHTDPTPNDHVAITLDGDAGNHLWWADLGDVEDLNWRTVRVDVIGFKVRVWIDGQLLVEQAYPELQFRGGYIFFSGSTGYYTNYHRFDDLNVIHTCQ
jgi:hypothetical protein